MELLAADDFAEGSAPIERPRRRVVLGFERRERDIEVEFIVEVFGSGDLAQPWCAFSMPRPGPTDRMAGGHVGRIAADDCGRELPRAFSLGDVGTARRLFQSPMCMQLVLDLPRRWIRPYAPRANDERRKTEYARKPFERGARMLIEFDRERWRFQ